MDNQFPMSSASFNNLTQKEHGDFCFHFIEKTMLLQEIENLQTSLINRPRRFGKIINLTMVVDFFDIDKKIFIKKFPLPNYRQRKRFLWSLYAQTSRSLF